MPNDIIEYYSPYVARKQFKNYHARAQRWAVLVAHRRFGKTVGTVEDLIERAIKHLEAGRPNPRLGYIAPFRNQAKGIAWNYLKQYTEFMPMRSVNEADLMVRIADAEIQLFGADNPDAIRGRYFDDVVLDEYADFNPRVWPEIIRPALADRGGAATFIGTPKGHNAFYHLWLAAQDDPEWFRMMLKASETGVLSQEELASMRKLMSEDQYAQEMECSFEAAIVGAIYGKWMQQAEDDGRINNQNVHDPRFPVYTAWDLGFGDSTAIWFYQLGHNEIIIIDYYENNGEGIKHYCEALAGHKILDDGKKGEPIEAHAHRAKYNYHTHYVPHDAANKTQAANGRSIIDQMRQYGVWTDTVMVECIPAVSQQNSIEAARFTLPICYWNRDNCHYGIEALKQYRFEYDADRKVFKDKPLHNFASHSSDAFEILARVWRAKSPTLLELRTKQHDARFHSLRAKANLDSSDPYRLRVKK